MKKKIDDKIQGDRKLRGKILKDSIGNKNKHFFSHRIYFRKGSL